MSKSAETVGLVIGLIEFLINWLSRTPISQGGPTKTELDAIDTKWQAARQRWSDYDQRQDDLPF